MQDFLMLGIFDFFNDMGFIIKLFVLVAILGFLNQYIENKILKVVVAIFMIYVIVFASSYLSYLYVIYAIAGMGISSLFVDYFFMSQGGSDHATDLIKNARREKEGILSGQHQGQQQKLQRPMNMLNMLRR